MSHNEKQQQTSRYSRKWHLPLLEEQWPSAEVFRTGEPFRGRYFFLYSVKEEEPTYGLPGLAHILPVASNGPYSSPLLVTAEEGRLQFGLLGVSSKTDLQRDYPSMTLKTMLSARWLFAVEWVSTLSAWDALLFTFDHLDSVFLCLKPAFVFPTLFVTRMAEHPQASVFQTVTAWAPLLDEMQEHLFTLILALYLHWVDGPSPAAQKLRAYEEKQDPLDEEQTALIEQEKATFQEEFHAFESIIGSARLQAFLHAEHLVPAVLRLLDEISWTLWDTTTPMRAQYRSVLGTHPPVRALLPIALWRPEVPHALTLARRQKLSLESLYEHWQSQQMATENHEKALKNDEEERTAHE
jgi:hypothetical protein